MSPRWSSLIGALLCAGCHGPSFILHFDGASCSATSTSGAGPASVQWTTELGRSGAPHAVGVGPDGSVAVAGMFSAEPRTSFVASLDRRGHVRWVREYPGHSTFSGVAIGKNGDIAVNATYRGEPLTLSGQTPSIVGEEDVYIAKWSAAGDAMWMRTLQGRYEDHAGPIVVDDAGDVHFAAQIPGDPIDLGTSKVTGMVVGTLASKDGAVLAATSFAGGRPLALALDRTAPSGHGVVLAGFYEHEMHLGYDAAQNERVLRAAYDYGGGVFVMKLRSPTDLAWADTAVSTHEYVQWYQTGPSVAVSPKGTIVVAANDQGGSNGRTTLLGTWDATGKRGWERCFTTEGGENDETAVAIDDNEVVSVAGNFQTGASYVDRGGPLFLVRYSAAGALLDSSVRFRSDKVSPGAVAIDELGRAVWIGAEFHGKSDEQPTDDIVVQAFGRRAD